MRTNLKSLVQIKPEGADSPWFFVHPAGGHVNCYRELAQLLTRPVFGFQARGVYGNESPLKTIEEMAAYYISNMVNQQPRGPYAIAAWSSGCVIAYEMAVQLKKIDEEVECLVLLDGPSPHDHRSVSDTDLLMCFFEDMVLDMPAEFVDAHDFNECDEREQLAKATALLSHRRNQQWNIDTLLPVYRVFKSVVRACRNYYPAGLDKDIALCRAAETLVSEFIGHPHISRVDWGWGLLTSGKIRCQLIAGNHYSMIEKPIVKNVARFINQVGFGVGQMKWRLA